LKAAVDQEYIVIRQFAARSGSRGFFPKAVIAPKNHYKNMSQSEMQKSLVIRYLGPLIPLGFGGFGIWLLITGRYAFRPGRSTTEVVLVAPDAFIAGGFFISLAILISALGFSGKCGRVLFWVGSIGSVFCIVFEAIRQIFGMAVYG
jgi:hypothetical protein